ncbi:MAG TPA: lactate racemase domain-containing protein [Bacteroidales bacterium]|nr:lactate racemase domain-containing protein [Bacteroidales bacterium]
MGNFTKNTMSRRSSLKLMGTGAVTLAGTSLFTRWGWSQSLPSSRTGNYVNIRTHEHYGDIEEQLMFPDTWELEVIHMKGHGHHGLTSEQIRAKLNQPYGSPTLREIADGKKTAVVTFDDLTRPTPINEVLHFMVDDLRAAGLRDENILFLTSFGSHRPMSHTEARAKLGDFIVDNFVWLNHNPWENLTEVGVTSRGNKIMVNYLFSGADLRITVSGIKGHGDAGYGGGAKAVLPGVAWINSIDYFHRTISCRGTNPTIGLAKVFNNDIRLDMEEAARLADVNFSVQIVYNEHRKPIDIFAGDIVEAHHNACRKANGILRTPAVSNADVVVANAYPQNRQALSSLGWARAGLRDGGSAVLIAQHPDALTTMHYFNERREYKGQSYWEHLQDGKKGVHQASQIIVFSQYMQKRDIDQITSKHVHLARSWNEVITLLQKQHRTELRVAVYPYAGIQHADVDLT